MTAIQWKDSTGLSGNIPAFLYSTGHGPGGRHGTTLLSRTPSRDSPMPASMRLSMSPSLPEKGCPSRSSSA